jgi:hypothetical protein
MKAQDLRISNIVEYKTSEGWMPNRIDWEDLKQATESPLYFQQAYRPMVLTEDILLKAGAKPTDYDGFLFDPDPKCNWTGHYRFYIYPGSKICRVERLKFNNKGCAFPCEYLHQLQNIVALTGEELKIEL